MKEADFVSWIEDKDEILIISHKDPDGDAIGSTLAINKILANFKKNTFMVNHSLIPKRYSFLLQNLKIFLPKQLKRKFRDVIIVDCADLTRIGDCLDLIEEDSNILVIDHHKTNTLYGSLNIVNSKAASTTEIIYDIAIACKLTLNVELATFLYVGMLTDSGCFCHKNTTPDLLLKASKCLEKGVNAHDVAKHLFKNIPKSQINLLKLALASLTFFSADRGAFIFLTLADFKKALATVEDTEGFVDYTINIEGVKVGLLFRETEEGEVKVSLRSPYIDVSKIAKKFGGGGHKEAAGCNLKLPLKKAIEEVISCITF